MCSKCFIGILLPFCVFTGRYLCFSVFLQGGIYVFQVFYRHFVTFLCFCVFTGRYLCVSVFLQGGIYVFLCFYWEVSMCFCVFTERYLCVSVFLQGGIYVFQVFDWYCATFALMTIALLEALVVGWIYGEIQCGLCCRVTFSATHFRLLDYSQSFKSMLHTERCP